MKGLSFLNSTPLYIEIGQSSLKALDGEDGLELSLERLENGRLTPPCAERLTLSLRVFLKKHRWRPGLRAFCALGARGVSLRRLSLPAASAEEVQRLLPLQIEREFPLAPDELAWGFRRLPQEGPSSNGAPAAQELLVAAVKKEVLQEYTTILAACGLSPVFTLAALARTVLCSKPPESCAMLDIGPSHSELIIFEHGAPVSLRLLPWGGENITRALEKALAISHADMEKLKLRLVEQTSSSPELAQKIRAVLAEELKSLVKCLAAHWQSGRLYLTGASAQFKELAPLMASRLASGIECEQVEMSSGEGRSAGILGLKRAWETNGAEPALVLQLSKRRATERQPPLFSWKWAALVVLLAAASLGLRYAEAFVQKPRMEKKLSEIRAYRAKVPDLERELSFLQYLKTNQPPYLDPLFALATAAPAGTRFDSLSLNHRGELSARASLRDSQQVADFRSKLLDSGVFSSVTVEDQTPSPDRQKVTVRITGQWKATPPS